GRADRARAWLSECPSLRRGQNLDRTIEIRFAADQRFRLAAVEIGLAQLARLGPIELAVLNVDRQAIRIIQPADKLSPLAAVELRAVERPAGRRPIDFLLDRIDAEAEDHARQVFEHR